MLRCIAVWRKSTWRKRQVLQPRPSSFLQAHFAHCVGARRTISIRAYMNIPWKFSIGAARSYLCLCCFCCVQTTCSVYPCSFLSPSWERGGEGGDVCFSQSCFGSCAVPMHSAALPLCQPLPRVAPGGHNKRLVSLFQLVANSVAWLQGLHMFISICNHTFLDAFLIPGKGHISTACWHKSHRQLQKRWDNKYTLIYTHTYT